MIQSCDTLLPGPGEEHIGEFDNGSVITRHVCYRFEAYPSEGEAIAVSDELREMLEDDWRDDLLAELGLDNNRGAARFFDRVLDRSIASLLEYRAAASEDSERRFPEGDLNFNVDEFAPRFGSGNNAALDYELEGSPHSSYHARDVAEHYLSLCADALRRSALEVVYTAFVDWVRETLAEPI